MTINDKMRGSRSEIKRELVFRFQQLDKEELRGVLENMLWNGFPGLWSNERHRLEQEIEMLGFGDCEIIDHD